MLLRQKVTYGLVGIVILVGVSGIGYSGWWSYQRLRAAEQVFAYLASAPAGQSKSRAELLNTILATLPPAPPLPAK